MLSSFVLAVSPDLARDFGVSRQVDPGFGVPVQWDVPILEGYESEFVPNLSPWPGTERFVGLWNPSLIKRPVLDSGTGGYRCSAQRPSVTKSPRPAAAAARL